MGEREQVREREYRYPCYGRQWPHKKPLKSIKPLPDGSLVRSEKQDKPGQSFDFERWS